MLEIKNAVTVITGGSGGIGKTLAEFWLNNGGKVLIADVQEESLTKALAELKEISKDVDSLVCDVTSEDDNKKLAEFAIKRFGAINLVAPFCWNYR